MKNEPLMLALLILISVILSGCIGQDNSKLESLENEIKQLKEQINETKKDRITPAPTRIAADNSTNNSANRTQTNKSLNTTPVATPQVKKFSRYNLYVTNDMEIPRVLGNGSYQIENWKIKIMNQQKEPLSIKAQVRSGEQVLEEYSFTLEEGSTKEFPNSKRYVVNNTNFTLRVLIKGYEPLDYDFNMVTQLN